MSELLRIRELDFEVRRSGRRTLGLTVGRTGELVVHAPDSAGETVLCDWVEKKLLWVHRKLALKEESAPKLRPPEYVTGEGFCYLGRRYRLKIVNEAKLPLQLVSGRFLLRSDARPAELHFRRWYTQNGSEWLRNRVELLSQRISVKPSRVQIRDLGFRWGSCGSNGALLFNWKVFQLPIRFVDYVIMHELVHLSERHHGLTFWQALGQALPDYEARKRDLAVQAKAYLVFGLPTAVMYRDR